MADGAQCSGRVGGLTLRHQKAVRQGMKSFRQYTAKRVQRISRLIQRMQAPFRVQDVHLLRVEIRKLNTLLSVLPRGVARKRRKKISGILKSLFRQAGRVRALQLLQHLLQQRQVSAALPVLQRRLILALRQEERQLAIRLMEARALDFPEITELLAQAGNREIRNALRRQSRKIDCSLRALPPETDALHRLRKSLKAGGYLLAACRLTATDAARNRQWMQQLGQWHDVAGHIALLQDQLRLSGIPETERGLLGPWLRRQQRGVLRMKTALQQHLQRVTAGTLNPLSPA